MAVDQINVWEVAEGMVIDIGGCDFTVGPKCDDKTAPGTWRCVTHGEGFANNMQMWSHTDDEQEHVIAWVCSAHGPEVP